MKKKSATLTAFAMTAALVLTVFSARSACELYRLDLINNQLSGPTYTANCATNVTPSQWEVRSDTCSLYTTSTTVPGDSGVITATPVSVRINRSGNLECNDWFKLEYSIDGVWFTVDSMSACDMSSAVQNYNFNVVCGALSAISVRVTYANNGGTPEKWFLKDGDICISTPIIPMPVELVSFSAQVENSRIKLLWTTASEKNNDYFIVERSKNGATYEKVEVVDGAGNSTTKKNYAAYDNNPVFGTSYYRLKQTDFDGSYEYSDAISVSVNFSSSTCKFKVIPNPCTPQCNIHMQGCEEQDISVALVDAMGNEVYSNIPVSEGNKSFTIDPTNNLKPGVYILTGRGKNEKPSQRMIVQ